MVKHPVPIYTAYCMCVSATCDDLLKNLERSLLLVVDYYFLLVITAQFTYIHDASGTATATAVASTAQPSAAAHY
eukprot:1235-Heterococcus_DN1.PRE.4